MTWLADEISVEDGAPREGIEIKHGNTVHRIATGSRDVEISGNTYFATPAERGAVEVPTTRGSDDLEIRLPVSHPYSQRYLASPPPETTVVVRRLQVNSGEAEQYWSGVVIGCTAAGHIVTFRCESRIQTALKRPLPTIGVSRQCVHVLYDKNCKVLRADFRVVATVASFSGKHVTLSTIDGKPDQWARHGELLHIPSGERAAVVAQVGTLLTLQRRIFDLRDAHAVHLFAGCTHDLATCRTKFDNVPNYGGLPELPRGNVFLPNGFGIYQSEPGEE